MSESDGDAVPVCRGKERADHNSKAVNLTVYPYTHLSPQALFIDRKNDITDTSRRN